MPIKNFSTMVDVGRTAGKIQRMLVAAGAKAIMTEFGDDGVMESLSFNIVTPQGRVGYRLPANVDGVEVCLTKQRVTPRFRTREHACKVAWRIVEDWIAAQLAIVESEMVTAQEVFLPYMLTDSGKTVAELFEEQGPSLLEGAKHDR